MHARQECCEEQRCVRCSRKASVHEASVFAGIQPAERQRVVAIPSWATSERGDVCRPRVWIRIVMDPPHTREQRRTMSIDVPAPREAATKQTGDGHPWRGGEPACSASAGMTHESRDESEYKGVSRRSSDVTMLAFASRSAHCRRAPAASQSLGAASAAATWRSPPLLHPMLLRSQHLRRRTRLHPRQTSSSLLNPRGAGRTGSGSRQLWQKRRRRRRFQQRKKERR